MGYPTLASVNAASLDQLTKWQKELPLPQTDVERSTLRRLNLRAESVKHSKHNDVIDKLIHVVKKASDMVGHNFDEEAMRKRLREDVRRES